MADRELLAATLSAGMLPTVPAPPTSKKTEREEAEILQAVAHAVSLYRAVLEALSVGPPVALPSPDRAENRKKVNSGMLHGSSAEPIGAGG